MFLARQHCKGSGCECDSCLRASGDKGEQRGKAMQMRWYVVAVRHRYVVVNQVDDRQSRSPSMLLC